MKVYRLINRHDNGDRDLRLVGECSLKPIPREQQYRNPVRFLTEIRDGLVVPIEQVEVWERVEWEAVFHHWGLLIEDSITDEELSRFPGWMPRPTEADQVGG